MKKLNLGVFGGVLLLCLIGCGGDETTVEPGVPYVTSTVPAEGAAGVDPATALISISFSELMKTTAGGLTIDGGATLGMPSWDGQTLNASVSGLQPDTRYKVSLNGFVDLTDVALDPARYLGDGALDFTTTPGGPDVDPPTAISSDPNEAQLDVAIDLASIVVTFDEAMDTAITQATLAGGPTDLALTGSWDAAGTTITFPVPEALEYSTAYRVDLSGYADVAGNALDGTPYLVDGALDFTSISNPDVLPPFVVSSTPVEGSFNLDPDLLVITATFSEAMDETITDVPLTEGGSAPQMVAGVWSDGDTVFTVTLADYLTTGVIVHVDFSGFADKAGNTIDVMHAYLVDGVLDFALANPSGESCNGPLVQSQATVAAGVYTWTIGAMQVASPNGTFPCDSTSGADAVVRYVKTSDTLGNGGNLLHVTASGQSDNVNITVVSGSCSASLGVVEKCLSNKQTWGAFLDLPPGPYWIWISDDDTAGGFPGATLTIEEIPSTAPQAQGEGCFAPYTIASSNYTPPPTTADPHLWTIPAGIHGYEISPATGAPGSISCDPSHGVDAVVEYQKASSTSTLYVEVNNLDPTITQSDLNVQLLTGCDTLDPASTSHFCDTNVDSTTFTASPPAGPVYVWVTTETSTEAFNGAEVKIKEFSPGSGETPTTPQPLTMSGPITPTSTVAVNRPSCFPTTTNVHWYSYTASSTLFGVQGNVAGALAVTDAMGTEIACSTDTTTVAIGKRTVASEVVLIAVESPSPIGSLNIIDQNYTGVGATVTNLGITFAQLATSEYNLTVGTNDIYLGNLSNVWSFPKTGNATAVQHGSAEGITTTHLGYDTTFVGGRLFGLDSTTTITTSRLYSIYNESTNLWGPTVWDTPANYPTSNALHSLTHDGTTIILAARLTTASLGVNFFEVSSSVAGAPVLLGNNTTVHYVTGIAADAAFFYVVGRDAALVEGIFRIDRANISAPAVRLGPADLNLTRTNIAIDNLAAATNIYVRDDVNVLHVVGVVGTTPIYLGGLFTLGGSDDYAMGMDRTTNTLYLFNSQLATNGGIAVVQ